MAQYAAGSNQETIVEPVARTAGIADPVPLGMSAVAFTTAIIGCSFAGWIVPSLRTGISLAVAVALFYGGIVQILAGMWEFRKDNTFAATLFSSYGGFLLAFGVIFLPGFGIYGALNRAGILPYTLGLLFLCWTIFTGVLFLASTRTHAAMMLTMILLFVAYLLLTIGELAGGNSVLFAIGGWFGIATAVVAWYTALADLLRVMNSPYQLPMGWVR
jgi:succinate-acetate transporter protein